MESDFNISLEGFSNNDEANSIGHFVLNVTKVLAERFSLDISKLKLVVITYNFGEALSRATSLYNHSAPSSFTESKQAIAIGQLVSKVGHDGLCEEYTLVLSVNFFMELFDNQGKVSINDNGVRNVIHRLHHELVHVHEKNTLTCLPQNFSVNEYGDVLLISATRAWSEYLANFISSRTVTKELLDDFLGNLVVVIKEVPNEILDIIMKYQFNTISLNEMYFEVKKRIRLIVNSHAYAMGYVHEQSINIEESFPDLFEAIITSKLHDELMCLSNAFRKQMNKYANSEIVSFNDFVDISNAIENIFKVFGVTLECTDWSMDSILHVNVK